MDTSDTYIKMCESATEIQELKPPQGIQYSCPLPLVGINEKGNWYAIGKGWLPRQDQLQEMLGGKWMGQLKQIWYGIQGERLIWIESWEQLWLAFVMKKRFGKIWNGEDWI